MNLVDMFYKSYKELRSRLEIPVMPVDSSGVEKFTAGNPAVMQLSGSNVEQANGADIALKSALVAGKTSAGKGVPIQVDADGKLQVGGITVESLTATTVGIDQTTPGTTNGVVSNGSKGTVKTVNLTDTTGVASGGTATLSSVVPAGKKWTVLEWGYSCAAPTGAASGTHTFGIYIQNTYLSIGYLVSVYNKKLQYVYGQFYDASSGAYFATSGGTVVVPDDHAAQINLLKKTVLQNGVDVKFSYTNNTNVAQTNTRTSYLLVLEEDIIA